MDYQFYNEDCFERMKKENKQLAKKRRAEEKKKQSIKKWSSLACKIGIPTILLLAVIIFCVTRPGKLTDSTNSTDATSYTVNTSYEVKNGDFFKIGIPFTLAAIIPAYIFIWVFFG